jgi:hypothetical protein
VLRRDSATEVGERCCGVAGRARPTCAAAAAERFSAIRALRSPRATCPRTKIVQGWPRLWANFRALIGIFSQSIGPSLAIWVNPVQFLLRDRDVSFAPRCWFRTAEHTE